MEKKYLLVIIRLLSVIASGVAVLLFKGSPNWSEHSEQAVDEIGDAITETKDFVQSL